MVVVVVTVVLAIVLRGGRVEIVEVLLRGGSSSVLLKACISKACCLHQVSRRLYRCFQAAADFQW